MENNKNIVKKSNSIISSRVADYSLVQMKIFNLAVSELTPETKESDILEFQAIDILNIIGLGEKNNDDLRKAISTINKKNAEILKPNGDIYYVPIFYRIIYKKGGNVTVQFHEDVLPLLIQAKKEYTKYYFENIQRLKSIYSIRIYELCKQYQNTDNGYRDFDLEQFRFFLDIKKDQYLRYVDFRKRILKSSILEINEKTDLTIEIEEFKRNRAVYKIRFYIVSKNDNTYKKIEDKQPSFSEEIEQLTPAGDKLVEDYIISKSVAIEIQVLATSDEHLFYAINLFNKKLERQIKRGNKPENLPRYAEISLREIIPTILISGAVEKEREANEKNRIKLEENNIKTNNESILKKKNDNLKNKFLDFCNNPNLEEILKNSDIIELLNKQETEEQKSISVKANEQCTKIFKCSIKELKLSDIFGILTNKVQKEGSNNFHTLIEIIDLKNYFKHTLKSLFMND